MENAVNSMLLGVLVLKIGKRWHFALLSMLKASGILPGTFYNMINRLKKSGYTIPEPASQTATMESLRNAIEQLRPDPKNKTAENAYLKGKLFGSSSERSR